MRNGILVLSSLLLATRKHFEYCEFLMYQLSMQPSGYFYVTFVTSDMDPYTRSSGPFEVAGYESLSFSCHDAVIYIQLNRHYRRNKCWNPIWI